MTGGKSPLSPAVEALIREKLGYLIRSTVIIDIKFADPEMDDEPTDG